MTAKISKYLLLVFIPPTDQPQPECQPLIHLKYFSLADQIWSKTMAILWYAALTGVPLFYNSTRDDVCSSYPAIKMSIAYLISIYKCISISEFLWKFTPPSQCKNKKYYFRKVMRGRSRSQRVVSGMNISPAIETSAASQQPSINEIKPRQSWWWNTLLMCFYIYLCNIVDQTSLFHFVT